MIRSTGNVACTSCGKPTDEPRRGLCLGCYQRARRGHVLDARCAICGAADVRVLRRHRLSLGLVTLCANDAAIAGRRRLTLGELRAEVYPPGDRRRASRRAGDRRAPTDRRTRQDVAALLTDERRRAPRRTR